MIDGVPALRSAVLVAEGVQHYVPGVPPVVIAAALLHRAEELAPLAGVADVDLDATLDAAAKGVAAIVRQVAAQRRAVQDGTPVAPALVNAARGAQLVAAVENIMLFRSLVARANRSPDPGAFWAAPDREVLRDQLPRYYEWVHLAANTGRLPRALDRDLLRAVIAVDSVVQSATVRGDA